MADIIISFDPTLHKYVDNFGIAYTSVTQFIGEYKPKFDEDYWAGVKAAERGITKAEVLFEWKTIRENACARGTTTHEFLEDSINNLYDKVDNDFNELIKRTQTPTYKYKITNEKELYSSPLRDKLPDVFYKLLNLIKAGYVLYAEVRTYSQKHRIAGTIDLLAVRDKEFIIVDWKTNKEDLKFESGYYKKEWGIVEGRRMKVKTNQWIRTNDYYDYPLNNVMQCKGNDYTLQLSLYAYLVELHGMKCMGLQLFHIINNEYDRLKAHKIEYIKNDIARVLDFHYKQKIDPQIKKHKFGIQ